MAEILEINCAESVGQNARNYSLQAVAIVNGKSIAVAGTEIFNPGSNRRFRLLGWTMWATAQQKMCFGDGGGGEGAWFIATVFATAVARDFLLPGGGYLSKEAGNKLFFASPGGANVCNGSVFLALE